jgi:hypothetical protein
MRRKIKTELKKIEIVKKAKELRDEIKAHKKEKALQLKEAKQEKLIEERKRKTAL